MATQRRFLASLADEALACKTRLPWERGLRRRAMIARRRESEAQKAPRARLAPCPMPRARAAG